MLMTGYSLPVIEFTHCINKATLCPVSDVPKYIREKVLINLGKQDETT
jgi:hypothetical protein